MRFSLQKPILIQPRTSLGKGPKRGPIENSPLVIPALHWLHDCTAASIVQGLVRRTRQGRTRRSAEHEQKIRAKIKSLEHIYDNEQSYATDLGEEDDLNNKAVENSGLPSHTLRPQQHRMRRSPPKISRQPFLTIFLLTYDREFFQLCKTHIL